MNDSFLLVQYIFNSVRMCLAVFLSMRMISYFISSGHLLLIRLVSPVQRGVFIFFSLVLFCWINQKFHIYKILKGRKTCWLIWALLFHFVSITLSPSCALHHICWTMETIFHFPWNIWSQLNCPVSQSASRRAFYSILFKWNSFSKRSFFQWHQPNLRRRHKFSVWQW